MPIRTATLNRQIKNNGVRLHLATVSRQHSHGADQPPSAAEQALLEERVKLKLARAQRQAAAKAPKPVAAKPVKVVKPVKAPKADKVEKAEKAPKAPTFLDDPYLFGRIAALHSVSDVYAMNARPFSALAIATLPYARGPIQAGQLRELLAGATRSLNELGVVLTGGHTSEGHDLSLGFAVTGYADEDQLFRKANLKPGDTLILTKPLGTGATLAAWMHGQCSAEEFNNGVAIVVN